MSITIGGEPTPDPIATTLHTNGYEPTRTSHERSSDRTSASTWTCRAWQVLVGADGQRADYANHRNLAVLEFRYMTARHLDGFSPLAKRFADGLAQLWDAPKPRRFQREKPTLQPLIRRTATSVQAIFRGEFSGELIDTTRQRRPLLYQHGLVAADERSVLFLGAAFIDVPISDAATWAGERSPLTVARADLPLWDSEAVSAAVAALVDKHVAAGDLAISDGYQEARRA